MVDGRRVHSERARGLPWAAATTVLAVAPLLAVLAAGRTLVWRDTARLFAPVRGLVVEALRGFRLPLWNPYEGLGQPLFAQQMHAVLHPFSVTASLLSPGSGMDLLIVAYVAAAAGGAFVLARGLGASPPAAAVCGLGFGLSGYVLSMSSVIQYLGAAGTAPWTAAALGAVGRRSRWGLPAAAAAVAAQVFAGDPQWLLAASALGSGLAWAAGGSRGFWRAAAAIAVGGAIGAVQLAPALAYLREADRSAGLTELDRAQWALAPARLLELALPGWFYGRPGEPSAPVFQWLGSPGDFPMPFVPSLFVGLPVLWLAARGAGASRAGRVLAAAAALFLWLALGEALGASRLIRPVPLLGAFRYAEKYAGPLTLCLAGLAALGADRIEPRRRTAAWAAGAAVVVGTAALLVLGLGPRDLLRAAGARAVAQEATQRLGVGLAHAAGAAALLALALVVASRSDRRAALPGLAAVAVAVPSLAAVPFAIHAGARLPRDDTILAAVRASDPLARIATPVPPSWGPADLDSWDRIEWAEARMGSPSHAVDARVCNVDAYSGILPTRYQLVVGILGERFGPSRFEAFRRLGVSHVVQAPAGDPEGAAVVRAATAGGRLLYRDERWGVVVWEVPHRPWASFVPGALRARDALEAHRMLAELVAAGRPEVALEGPPPPAFTPGRIISAERDAERLRVEAESSGPGLLVLNEQWAPGWHATLDGAAVEVLAADAAARAVAWPPGRHRLEMRYEPFAVRVGIAVAVAGLLALGALFARALRAPSLPGGPGAAPPAQARAK